MTALLIDSSGQIGRLSHGAALRGDINLGLRAASQLAATRADAAKKRLDSRELLTHHFAQQAQRRVDAMAAEAGIRADGFDPAIGGVGQRDLTVTIGEAMREPLPKPNGIELFPMNSAVPAGAEFYNWRRLYHAGEAVVYRGGPGGDIPRVTIANAESEPRPVHVLAIAVDQDFRAGLAAGFTGFDDMGEKVRGARSIMDRTVSGLIWNGSEEHNLWGILTYPYMDKLVSATPISTSSTGDAIIEAIGDLLSYPRTTSKATFQPNAVVMSPSIAAYLKRTYPDNKGGKSLYELITLAHPEIKSWEEAHELDATGPGSAHGILVYRKDSFGLEYVVSLPPTMLPMTSMGLASTGFLVCGFGGVRMADVGNNVLGWFEV